jgi:peptidoglycan/xylan/chitin deacetylase (PgdA/CDA1 family)
VAVATLMVACLVACTSHATVSSIPVARTSTSAPSPTPTPSPTPALSPCYTQNVAPPAALQPYLSRIPHFDPPPTPIPVTLPHGAGQAAFAYEIPTTQRVAFLTIDDGIVKHPLALPLMQAAKIPVTLFLTTNFIAQTKDYFKALRDTGCATIQDHTVSHPDLTTLGYQGAKNQLCQARDNLANWYGTTPTLFRPPFGNYNSTVLKAAWDCGLPVGFYWRETVDSGHVYYQRDTGHIHAGDIILMHFRAAFPDDFLAALNAIKNSGLTPALLDDYVRVGGETTGAAPEVHNNTATEGGSAGNAPPTT